MTIIKYILKICSVLILFLPMAVSASTLESIGTDWTYSQDGVNWAQIATPCLQRYQRPLEAITFRRTLKDLDKIENPSIYINVMSQPFEAKLNGVSVYKYMDTNGDGRQFRGYPWHLIELRSPLIERRSQAILDLTVRSNQQVFLGFCKKIMLGDRDSVYAAIFKNDIGILMSLFVLTSMGLVSVYFALVYSKRRKLLVSFAALCFLISVWIFSTPELKSRLFVVEDPQFWMPLSHIGLFLIPVAFIFYLKELFKNAIWRIVLWMAAVHGAYAALAIFLMAIGRYDHPTSNYYFNLIIPFSVLMVLGNIAVLVIKNEYKARLVSMGFGVFMLVAIHDWLVGMWFLVGADLWLHWGFLGLMGILAISIVSELRAVFESEREIGIAEEKYQLVKELAENVAHDVKKPFTLLRMTMARLSDCQSTDEFKQIAEENSKAIVSKSLQVEEALNAFLDLENTSSLCKESVSVKQLLDETLLGYEPEFKKNGVRIVISHGYKGVAVLDVSKMRRVIANLVQNAIEAQPLGGELVVKTSRKWLSTVEISFKTPTLIPAKEVKNLFNRYFTFGKAESTGLGLSIVKKFTELHGGVVSCVSKQSMGTIFTLRIPMG
ncbi:MAG: ATP-binding protein [Proteobacteria bacterium]|nr:ATP-binding protein [Pseudomonadota bacterium]